MCGEGNRRRSTEFKRRAELGFQIPVAELVAEKAEDEGTRPTMYAISEFPHSVIQYRHSRGTDLLRNHSPLPHYR